MTQVHYLVLALPAVVVAIATASDATARHGAASRAWLTIALALIVAGEIARGAMAAFSRRPRRHRGARGACRMGP